MLLNINETLTKCNVFTKRFDNNHQVLYAVKTYILKSML